MTLDKERGKEIRDEYLNPPSDAYDQRSFAAGWAQGKQDIVYLVDVEIQILENDGAQRPLRNRLMSLKKKMLNFKSFFIPSGK